MCRVKLEDWGVTKIMDLFKVGIEGESHILVIPWFLALPNIKQLGKKSSHFFHLLLNKMILS
jgi:hypothetical protein